MLLLATCFILLSLAGGVSAQVDGTGFSITNPAFLDYYQHRGGARVLGDPISREFLFRGSRVQLLQRAALQLRADGTVGLLNLPGEGLLPYTRFNGLTFPIANPLVVQAAPSPADPDFPGKALEFVRANAPDLWEGLNTNFYSTFVSTVAYEEAFTQGDGDPVALSLIGLEIWGMPTSRPTRDPYNDDAVYLRFQRGIMQFDAKTGLTRWLPMGEYLKSVLTGQDLPADLERDAATSKLLRQYDNRLPRGVARPSELPDTDLLGAFEPDGVAVPIPPSPVAEAPAAPVPDSTATGPFPAARITIPPTAVPLQAPGQIEVVGSDWFVDQVNKALGILSARAPGHYANVRQYVYRIEEAYGPASVDFARRMLKIDEDSAFVPNWRSHQDNQAEWLASLIVHNAFHIEQAAAGRPYSGYDAELEAALRQKDALVQVETTKIFSTSLGDTINTGVALLCWGWPPDP